MAKQKRNKKDRTGLKYSIGIILLDLILLGVCLCTFAYFHHVRKAAMVSDDIQVNTDNVVIDAEKGSSSMVYWKDLYADKFTDTVEWTPTSYTSPGVSVSIEKTVTTLNGGPLVYYVADIHISDIRSFERVFANDTFGSYREAVIDMGKNAGAILTMNGDYYGNQSAGIVIRNGTVYRSKASDSDVCILFYDGTMKTYSPDGFDLDAVLEEAPYQSWSFGPMLLDENGEVLSSFNVSDYVFDTNPRSGLGYYSPGHYCFVVVDGRWTDYSWGVTIKEYAEIFHELGCKQAYNMDGGQSSVLTFNGAYVNKEIYGGRDMSDCLIIKEVDHDESL